MVIFTRRGREKQERDNEKMSAAKSRSFSLLFSLLYHFLHSFEKSLPSIRENEELEGREEEEKNSLAPTRQ